jgi:large subunit ribosomal protein L17
MLRRNLITDLFRHDKIKTTEAKAKAVKAQAERFVTLARNRGDAERLLELAEDRDEATLRLLLTDGQVNRLLALVDAGDQDGVERETRAIASHAQRLIARDITDREVVHRLFHDVAPRYINRTGGYTRILRLGRRKGDAAEMVMLALVEEES